MKKKIAVIGLGVVGAPLSYLLSKKYKDDFVLLSSPDYIHTLTKHDLYINGELFNPCVISNKAQLSSPIGVVFVCVKNYHVKHTIDFLRKLIDKDTIIVPLQNGVYSFDTFSKDFPNNVVIEGFAQGPNTQINEGWSFTYQKPGSFHIGSSQINYKVYAKNVCSLMKDANIMANYYDDIKYHVWKKLMLNVAGNAITALTGIDYFMIKKSEESQYVLKRAMTDYLKVANSIGVNLSEKDIDDVFNYYFSFTVSKKTSMLEDIINKRPTENEYLAGYIRKLAQRLNIDIPYIDELYNLIKIKEDVYLSKLD